MGLSKREIEIVYELASRLTGTDQSGAQKHEVLVSNVERRMSETGIRDLSSYLKLAQTDQSNFENLISDLTIHTTSWFRENPHFKAISRKIENELKDSDSSKKFLVWSAASSTGEEVYSLALVLEALREKYGLRFDYSIRGSDVDPVSVKTAKKAVYKQSDIKQIPESFRKYLMLGSGKAKGYFTLSKEIRNRCQFFVHNLTDEPNQSFGSELDLIFCRNVLIYFSHSIQSQIISKLSKKLKNNGLLVLGHCDSFPSNHEIRSIGQSCFEKMPAPKLPIAAFEKKQKTALIVDDSALIRKVVKKSLQEKFQVIEADSAEEATRILSQTSVDFISLDLNLPGESGASWLTQFRKINQKTPVVILSDSSAVDAQRIFGALLGGAQDYVTKSQLHGNDQYMSEIATSLTEDKSSSDSYPEIQPFKNKTFEPKLILIGASTGGPEALSKLLKSLPAQLPPIIVVQHISFEFARAFAERIGDHSKIETISVLDSTPLVRGHIYISGGDVHLEVQKNGGRIFVVPSHREKILGHRPSVDALFSSAADLKIDSLAILLTGMGRDGADGLLKLYKSGRCFTIAQDARSSVVFGMPKKAIEAGAVAFVGDVLQIRNELLRRSEVK